MVAKCIRTRNCSQVRSHAQKYFERVGKIEVENEGWEGNVSEPISDQEE
jgi:hypothetical protein